MSYLIPIIVVVLSSVLGAFAAMFLKKGSKKGLFSKNIILGISLYGAGAIIFVIALKYAPVSILYPVTAATYIWSFIIAGAHFKEKITIMKIMGLCLIILGIVLISLV